MARLTIDKHKHSSTLSTHVDRQTSTHPYKGCRFVDTGVDSNRRAFAKLANPNRRRLTKRQAVLLLDWWRP